VLTAHATWFLWIAGAVYLVVYALPLLLAPVVWARWFRWSIPADRDLAVYLGRCVGALAVAMIALTFRAATRPELRPIAFELIALVSALLTLVHVWGALRREQPWTEHVEIAIYLGITAYAAIVRWG
jgi:hypothetical protein